MVQEIYVLAYASMDMRYDELHKVIEGAYTSLEKAKNALMEKLDENYPECIEEQGADFYTDNISPDGLEFEIEIGDYLQSFWIEKTVLA